MKNIFIFLLMVSYIFCNRWVTIDNQVVSNDKLIILISESYAPLLGIEQPLNISSIFSIESTLVDITEKNMHPLFSNFPQFEGKHRQFNLHRYYVLEFEQQTDIQSLAAQLSIRGTPAFIIGDEIIPGAIDLNGFAEKIKLLRAKNENK